MHLVLNQMTNLIQLKIFNHFIGFRVLKFIKMAIN